MAANTALAKIQKRVKQLRKDHPNMKFRNAQKQAGAEYRAGKLGAVRSTAKKAAGVKAKPAKKKTVIRTERLTTIGKRPVKKRSVTGVSGDVKRADAIVRKMESLQKKVAACKSRELKDVYKMAYNAEYDKLSALKKQIRAR